MQRETFGPMQDEVTGDWSKVYGKQLSDLNSPRTIIWESKSRRIRCSGHVASMGESKDACSFLVGKSEGRNRLGRRRRRWEDNIKVGFK